MSTKDSQLILDVLYKGNSSALPIHNYKHVANEVFVSHIYILCIVYVSLFVVLFWKMTSFIFVAV